MVQPTTSIFFSGGKRFRLPIKKVDLNIFAKKKKKKKRRCGCAAIAAAASALLVASSAMAAEVLPGKEGGALAYDPTEFSVASGEKITWYDGNNAFVIRAAA